MTTIVKDPVLNDALGYFPTPTGLIVTSVVVMLLISLPLIIGPYVTKSIVVKCKEQSIEEFMTRFENTKNFLILITVLFEIALILLLHKFFGLGAMILDPIVAIPSKFDDGLEYRGWLLIAFVIAVILAATYGFATLMGKSFVGQTYEDDLSYFYKRQDALVGATFVVLLIFLGLAFVGAKLSLNEPLYKSRSKKKSSQKRKSRSKSPRRRRSSSIRKEIMRQLAGRR